MSRYWNNCVNVKVPEHRTAGNEDADAEKETFAKECSAVESGMRSQPEKVPAAAPPVDEVIVGHWKSARTQPFPSGGCWFVYGANHAAECSNGDIGQWTSVESTERQYSIAWGSGSVDTITFSEDGMTGHVENKSGELYSIFRQVVQ